MTAFIAGTVARASLRASAGAPRSLSVVILAPWLTPQGRGAPIFRKRETVRSTSLKLRSKTFTRGGHG